MAHQGSSPSIVVHRSLCLLMYMKGKTQLPHLPELIVELEVSGVVVPGLVGVVFVVFVGIVVVVVAGVVVFVVAGVVVVVVVAAALAILSAEAVLPVNVVNCSWIVSTASTMFTMAASISSTSDVRDPNSSSEQVIEDAPVIWRDKTRMFGLEGKFMANCVS